MNSVIFKLLCKFWISFSNAFLNSFTYKIFDKVYTSISKSWANSRIISFFRKDEICGQEKHSVLYKCLLLPFNFFELVGKKFGSKIKKSINQSFIINVSYDFMNNILALNSRVLGIFILSFVVTNQVINRNFSILPIVLTVVGLFFLLVDYNITDFFSESKFIKFLLKCFGFYDVSWDFYEKESLKKVFPLIISILLGCLSAVFKEKSIVFMAIPVVSYVGIFLVLKYPLVGIFATFFLAPFIPTMLLAGLVLFTGFSYIVYSVSNGLDRWKVDGVGVGLSIFLLFMLASSIFSFSRNTSILVWGLYLIFIAFYFVITNAVVTKAQIYNLLKIFVIAGIIVSIYGVLQYIFKWDTSNAWIDEDMFESATMRAYSTMENPNVLGEYLLLTIPLTAFFLLKKENTILERLVWLFALGVGIICMVFTQSRGCWIGLFAATAIFLTFYNGKLWGLLPFFLLLLPFVIPDAMIDRFLSVGNLEDSSTSYRVFIWLGTIQMLKDFWLGGIGMGEGAFRNVYPLYSYNSIIAPHSHNLYLQLLVEGGIVALLIFLVTMIIFVKKLSRVYINSGRKDEDSILSLAIVSGVIGFLIQSLFDYTFYNYRMMAMFFMIISVAMVLCSIKGVKEYDRKN